MTYGTSFYGFYSREKEYIPDVSRQCNIVFCNNVPGLISTFNIHYKPEDSRLFMDSSKTSLKPVLLHSGNKYASLPIGLSIHLSEYYENLKFIINRHY